MEVGGRATHEQSACKERKNEDCYYLGTLKVTAIKRQHQMNRIAWEEMLHVKDERVRKQERTTNR